MQKEIEVKFKIEDKESIIKKLTELEGIFSEPYKQDTYGFFSDDSREKGIFPRIRNEGEDIVLTIKVRPQKEDKDYFERTEYSMKISDVEEGKNILNILGFHTVRFFQKTRQECEALKASITIDELYFGTFIEIEGEKEDIENMIERLGLEKEERITKSYLALEDEYKKTE